MPAHDENERESNHSRPSVEVNDSENRTRVRTPLPVLPLLGVFLIQLGEPIAATVIYPFIAQFIRNLDITGGDEKKTGYYAGIIESAFFFSQTLSVVQWGYLSDRYGRRTVLLCGPLGVACAMLMFGSSTTFAGMLVSRCLQGIFNGNIGTSKSVIAELTDSTNRADAYAFIPLMWCAGATLGPILGGVLSNPATRWPDSLGKISYLKTHPYFLPCFVAACFSFFTFLIVCFALEETLPSLVTQKKRERVPTSIDIIDSLPSTAESPLVDPANHITYGTQDSNSRQNNPDCVKEVQKPKFRDAFTRPILVTLLNNSFLAFLDMCYAVLLPLMYSTSIQNGGLGLDPSRIGATLGTFGLVNSIVQLNFLGKVIRKYGARRVYRASFHCFIILFSMYVITKMFAQRAGEVDHIVVACMVFQLGCQMFILAAYGSIQVLLVENIPEGGPLGTVNGVFQMCGASMRCIAPTFASSLFSVSLQRNLAGGNMVYYILMVISLVGIRCSRLLPASSKENRTRRSLPAA